MRLSENASFNFSIAKVVAIFTVVAGHWFTGTILWIPVTFGLFVFAFSSGYFTAKIYGVDIDRGKFWRKKIDRLAVRYWVALVFLAILAASKGGEILDWQTIVHFLGLSGMLNWFGIRNDSALGAGLWFFTLLLAFYIAYPYLAKVSKSKLTAIAISLISIAAAVALEEYVKVGHELWLTMLGFVVGVTYGLHETPSRPVLVLGAAVASSLLLVDLNLLTLYKQFNTALIVGTSLFLSIWLSQAVLPKWKWARAIAKMDQYLLEIFLIHTYLFTHFTGNTWLDFIVSVGLTVLTAIALNYVVAQTSKVLDRDRLLGQHAKPDVEIALKAGV